MRKLHADPEFAAANAERGREHLRKLHTDPEFAAANAARGRERQAKRRGYAIPQWVRDADLVPVFTTLAKVAGPDSAARHCRRLITELRAEP